MITPARTPIDLSRCKAARLLAAALVVLLQPLPHLRAQQPQDTIVTSAPLTLHIDILDGEGALNNIRERTAREPIVQVEDQNHKPVAGVTVIFSTLDGPSGASGSFNAATSFRTVTDAQGKAVGHGLAPNATSGQFSIQVEATTGSISTKAVIHEINTPNGSLVSETTTSASQGTGSATASTTAAAGKGLVHIFHIIPKWVVVGVAATSASVVAVAVTHTTPGATISSGGGTVTAPAATKPGTAPR